MQIEDNLRLLKSLASKVDAELAKDIADEVTKEVTKFLVENDMSVKSEDGISNAVADLLNLASNALIPESEVKKMNEKNLESVDAKSKRQDHQDQTWIEQNYFDKISKKRIRKKVEKNKDLVKSISDKGSETMGKLQDKMSKSTCMGCEARTLKPKTGSVGSVKLDPTAKLGEITLPGGILLDLSDEDDETSESEMETVVGAGVLKTADSASMIGGHDKLKHSENPDEIDMSEVDDPKNMKEPESKKIGVQASDKNDLVTSGADCLIGKTAKLSVSTKSGVLKMKVPNDDSQIKSVYNAPFSLNMNTTDESGRGTRSLGSNTTETLTEETSESEDPLANGYSSPLSVSKFEPQQNSAILVVIEPDHSC